MIKKLYLFITIAFLFLVNVEIVNATEEKTTFSISQSIGNAEDFNIGIIDGDQDFLKGRDSYYYSATGEGEAQDAYCIDPRLSNDGATSEYYVARTLMSSSSKTTNAGDAGLMAIMTSDADYDAKFTAIRAYYLGFLGVDNSNSSALNNQRLAGALVNLTAEWIKKADKGALSDAASINKHATVARKAWFTQTPFAGVIPNQYEYVDLGKGFKSTVFGLLDTALAASAAYLEGGDTDAGVFAPKVSVDSSEVDSETNSGTVTVTVSNLGGQIFESFKLTQSGKNVTAETDYKDKKVDEISFSFPVNLGDDCKAIPFEITYEFAATAGGGIGVLLKSTGSGVRQDMIMLSNEPMTLKGSISLCDGCEGTFTVPDQCTTAGEKLTFEASDPYTVVGCIVPDPEGEATNALVDKASNPYEVDNCKTGMSNVGDGSSNDYCSVSCAESYDPITLPGIQKTNSGRYFTLEASISGTKSCYTSKIDIDQFIDDIISAQKAMIAAHNQWHYYEKALPVDIETFNDSGCDGKSYTLKKYKTDRDSYSHINITNTNDETGVVSTSRSTKSAWVGDRSDSVDDEYETKTRTVIEWLVDDDGISKPFEVEEEYEVCVGSSADRVENPEDTIDSKMSEAESDYATAKAKFNKAIKDIQSCGTIGGITDMWFMDFKLIPEIEYSYEDGYIDLLGGSDTMIYKESVSGPSEVRSSSENVNSTYEFDESAQDFTRNFLDCTSVSVCAHTSYTVSNAHYVKQTMTKTIEYTTDNVFYQNYPNGNIIVSDENEDAFSDSTNQYLRVEGLPVKPNQNYIEHNFSFEISNFGEYFDNCTSEGGRLNEVGEFYNFRGTYVCQYLTDCPECEFGVTDPEDPFCPTCIFKVGDMNIIYRNVSNESTDTFNPNDRELGSNWDYTISSTYTFLQGKAQATLGVDGNGNPHPTYNEGILRVGDGVYAKEEPIMVVTMTPDLAQELRTYNNSVAGYANDTLTCENYGDYEYVLCYSDYLSELIADFEDSFEVTDSRGNKNDYWKTYVTGIPDYNSDLTDQSYIGGPSWK